MDRRRQEGLIAARRQRREAAAVVELLRSFYYPKQRALFCGKSKLKATKKTRRAGATSGGCRELVARAIEHPGFRATYVTTTRGEAKERAWENDNRNGLADILREFGKPVEAEIESVVIGGVTVEIRAGDLALEFSNGSRIDLFGAENMRMIGRKRGTAKHVFWIDEAQDFTHLDYFYKAVVVPALSDFKGECWVTGTPGRDCVGFFWELTRDDGEPRLEGWDVHEIAAVDNPRFGRVTCSGDTWYVVDNGDARHGPYATEALAEEAAILIRWEGTAGEAIRLNGWSEDDPDLLREQFGRWVKEGARYVYAVHSVPEHQLTYAPVRLDANGFPDVKRAMLDLPGYVDEERDYFLALGADLGTRAAFAFVVWAWSMRDPILYEVCSWSKTGLDYDEMATYLKAVRSQVTIGLMVADAGGGGKPAVMGWSKKWVSQYGIPIIEATKANKVIAIQTMNADIRKRRLRCRIGSAWLREAKVHVWAPQRSDTGGLVESSKTKHDLTDSALYGHRESYHHRYRELELTPEPNTPEWLRREEADLAEHAARSGADEEYPFG
jgi:hypothetical protein